MTHRFRQLLMIVLASLVLAGCSGADVIDILRKKRQGVTGYEIRVTGLQEEGHPHNFTRFDVVHVVDGERALDALESDMALDSLLANLALPGIARELNAPASQAIWVVNAYQVATLGLLLPCAMLGDLIIARPLLIGATAIGVVAFVVSLPFTALGGNVAEAGEALATPSDAWPHDFSPQT